MGAAALPIMLIGGGIVAGATASALSNKPPAPIRNLPTNEASKSEFKPVNFVSIMDDMMGSKMDLVRGVDGRIKLNITEPNRRTNVYAIDGRISDKALGIIAISDAMTKLGNTIEEMERTSPFLIPQNQELINTYKTAVKGALDRGFDIKQQSIDSKLSKMGLSNSSSALNVQLALAREKTNSYANLALKESELAQNLKQQAIQNLNSRGKILNDQATIGLNQVGQDIQMRGQDFQKELGYAKLAEDRKQFAIKAGIDLLNTGNQNALNARQIDNSAVANYNQANLASYALQSDPINEALSGVSGAMVGAGLDKIIPGYSTALNANKKSNQR